MTSARPSRFASYELARNPQAVPHPPVHAATAADLERLTALLLDAVRSSGYLKWSPSGSQKRRSAAPPRKKSVASSVASPLRRRRRLTLGILRQIFWKLVSAKTPCPDDFLSPAS